MAGPAFRVAFYDDPIFREHDSGPGHPERPERLTAVAAAGEALRQRLTELVAGRLHLEGR